MALVFPGVNVTLLARDLVLGQATTIAIVVVFATTLGYGAAALALAARLYDSERLLGADDATLSLRAWLRRVATGSRAGGRGRDDAANRPRHHRRARDRAVRVRLDRVAGGDPAADLARGRPEPGPADVRVGRPRRPGGDLRARQRPPAEDRAALAPPVVPVARGRHPDRRLRPGWWSASLATWIAPAPKEVVDSLRRVIAPPGGERGILLTLFLMAVTPAVCEEMLFRGPILRGFATRFSPAGAAILTGLLFGLYHGDVWRFLPTAVLGVMLSAIALRGRLDHPGDGRPLREQRLARAPGPR